MSTRNGILAAGNWIIDHTKIIDVFPTQDALCNILAESHSNGGSPYNLLVDLARLGAPFPLEALGLIGDDTDGESIRADCARHHIDTRRLRITRDAHTSYTDVMSVRTTGRRTFFHQRGANALLGPEHFDFTTSRAKFFHLGYLLLLDRLDGPDPAHGTAAAALLAQARAAGFVTSIDVVSEDSARFPDVVRPALPHTDHTILNEFEAERTTGCAIRTARGLDATQLRAAARALLGAGVRQWVVIHFPEGALAAHADGRILFQGSVLLPQDQIAGTTGAGDAFGAGLLFGLHEGRPMEQCLRDAVCAAASCLTAVNCSGGIGSLEQCLKLGAAHGFRAESAVFPA
ncbi:MAG TPA: carbohydrate kinase family protein [Candidatus Methylacidiphilales bacterium]|jgi:sugar/nucleoside kinase (ribokinase family)|nr:carbohydrate kinase family protein [Candidatus Methylacidiphilales bacterium]